MFQDKKSVVILGKALVIRQRSIRDIMYLEASIRNNRTKESAGGLLLAQLVLDSIKHDNYYKKVLFFKIRWTLKRVIKSFSMDGLTMLQKEIDNLEAYGEKKTLEKVVG